MTLAAWRLSPRLVDYMSSVLIRYGHQALMLGSQTKISEYILMRRQADESILMWVGQNTAGRIMWTIINAF